MAIKYKAGRKNKHL